MCLYDYEQLTPSQERQASYACEENRRVIGESKESSGNTNQAQLRHVMVIEGMVSPQCL